jgi:hypothetical protein
MHPPLKHLRRAEDIRKVQKEALETPPLHYNNNVLAACYCASCWLKRRKVNYSEGAISLIARRLLVVLLLFSVLSAPTSLLFAVSRANIYCGRSHFTYAFVFYSSPGSC